MKKIVIIVFPVIFIALRSIAADSQSFSVVFGDCYGQFYFTDTKAQEFCKPNISEAQCLALVEHYEKRFKEKYKSFYHASLILDATSTRTGCAFQKPFPR